MQEQEQVDLCASPLAPPTKRPRLQPDYVDLIEADEPCSSEGRLAPEPHALLSPRQPTAATHTTLFFPPCRRPGPGGGPRGGSGGRQR